jgi:ABC-2 type transport system permease protein
MNWKKILAVIRREYVERVRTKLFWVATLLIPIFFLVFLVVQILAYEKAGGERRLAVVDTTGKFYAPLEHEIEAQEQERKAKRPKERGPHWVLEQKSISGDLETAKEALRKHVFAKRLDAYLVVTPALLEKDQIQYYSTTVSEWVVLGQLERTLTRIRLREKIAARGLPPDLGNDLEKRIDLKSFKVTASGTAEEKGAGIIAAIVFFFVMYSTFLVYGAQVMRGVIEEKSTRIVEVVIASVRPTELMLGKMIGIGLVGLTQYATWSLVAMNLSLPVVVQKLAASEVGAPRIPLSTLAYFVLFFILGYFLYAGVYTAVAAPFNTDQEAQQLAMIPVFLIVSCVAVYPAVLNNPNGAVAVAVSLFPFTAPLSMFLRTAISEVSAWQVGLSVLILIATTVGIAWFAGRIYRVGILMYGKKPTISEILRWVRYKPGKVVQPAATHVA